MSTSASTSESAQELAVRFLDAGSSSDAGAAPSSSPIPKQLAAMIASRQAHLLEVVKASAGHLTSEDDKKRGRGIGLLAHVVIRCPKEAVKRQEGKTLSEFFISSLSSPVSEDVLVPALEGLAALAKLPSFGATEAQTVAKTIFANVDLHGRPQTTRYFCYCLFDVLLAYQRAALKKMGKPFLTGYCALVTGEKDPRNLRLAFSIAKILILEFDIADNVQELFDITFCYFPITFTPPPNDPYGITSEQLQGSLRDCLSATPRFGPLALPLFLEKLQATSNTAKKQTLQAFVAAFPVYGKAVVTPDAVTIWEAISMEIYHASDSEMEEHALKALKALLETLYPDGTEEAVSNDATKSVARRLSDACLLELKDSNKSNAKPASRILARAISASGILARYLVPKAFEQLLHIYKVPDEIQQRPALFTVMARLLEQLRECPVANPAEAFLDFREEVLSLCTSSLALSTTGSQALDCLVQLVQLPGCLDGDELVFALQSITSLLVSVGSPDVGEDASAAALDGLASVSQLFPKRIEETVLPSLFGRLPDRAPSINDRPAIASYRLALACLATLCVLPELFEVLLIRLLSRLESTCNFKTEEPAQHAQNNLYAHHLLTTLRVVLEKKIAAGHKDVAIRATSITSRLYGLFIPPTLTNEEIRTAATEPRILEDAGRILMLLVQQLDEKAQRDLNTALRLAYFENKPTGLLGGSPKKASERSLTPFGPGASTSQINLVLLYAFPLYAVRKEVFDSLQDLSRLCETLLVEALPRWSGARPFEPSCKLLASLLNKRADSLPDFVDVTLPAFWDERIGTVMADSNSRKAALTVWAWSMRGLIVRSDNRAYDGVAKLVSLFADEGLSKAAARTMAILSKDNDAVLTKENGAVIRLLYKQRFFSFILPKLVHGYHAASTDASKATPYLVGLSCLLQSMPKQTIITELPKLLPLLMRALELPELDLRAHVIDTLALLVRDTPDAVKHQASTLVGLLLKNATCTDPARDSEAFVQLRVSALGCLTVFPDTIDWLALHQQKAPVLKALGAIVDDRKKRVRKEAVDCRTRWFLFKAP